MDSQRKKPSLDHWHWLRTRVRCALPFSHGEDLIFARLNVETEAMVHCGQLDAWFAHEANFRLLHETALDLALPFAWRQQCLSRACRPIDVLEQLARDAAHRQRVAALSRRLAMTQLEQSLPLYSRHEARHHRQWRP